MDRTEHTLQEFTRLVFKYAPDDGMHPTTIEKLGVFRESEPHSLKPRLYDPFIIFLAQGRKRVRLGDVSYEYNPGHFLVTLAPIPVECQVIEASPESPLAGIGIALDRQRMLQVLMKMDQAEPPSEIPGNTDPSGIFIAPLNDRLLEAAIRLLKSLHDPCEATIVGEAAIDEIYFRILREERGGALTHLLQQRGQIQQIARAVDHVHQNLSQPVSVEELAGLVNMSSSGFHQKFKEVMHLSPLQYAKRVKLNRAQAHIREGTNVSQAGYLVGYNSPAQFSREYKRHFGIAPSEDRAN